VIVVFFSRDGFFLVFLPHNRAALKKNTGPEEKHTATLA